VIVLRVRYICVVERVDGVCVWVRVVGRYGGVIMERGGSGIYKGVGLL
jgi:hypothetical protein